MVSLSRGNRDCGAGVTMTNHPLQNHNDKRTTLNPNFKCIKCGEPAAVYVDRWLYCPACYLKKQGAKIKALDHTGFYP